MILEKEQKWWFYMQLYSDYQFSVATCDGNEISALSSSTPSNNTVIVTFNQQASSFRGRYLTGTIATFTCKNDQISVIYGAKRATCQNDGSWLISGSTVDLKPICSTPILYIYIGIRILNILIEFENRKKLTVRFRGISKVQIFSIIFRKCIYWFFHDCVSKKIVTVACRLKFKE